MGLCVSGEILSSVRDYVSDRQAWKRASDGVAENVFDRCWEAFLTCEGRRNDGKFFWIGREGCACCEAQLPQGILNLFMIQGMARGVPVRRGLGKCSL